MSTDWNVHCLDCKETHTFCDANHMDAEMATLCKHAAAIAALAPLMAESDYLEFRLGSRGEIDTTWFAKHAGHRLVPISEYGDILGQCAVHVKCVCGSRRQCTKDYGHDGDHDPEARR